MLGMTDYWIAYFEGSISAEELRAVMERMRDDPQAEA
jgi:hypothetical protein